MPATPTLIDTALGERGGRTWGELAQAMDSAGYEVNPEGVKKFAAVLSRAGCEVSERTLWSWLRKERSPSVATLRTVAEALNVSAGDILPA